MSNTNPIGNQFPNSLTSGIVSSPTSSSSLTGLQNTLNSDMQLQIQMEAMMQKFGEASTILSDLSNMEQQIIQNTKING